MTRQALSSNHYSVDLQAVDAMNWIEAHEPAAYAAIIAEFPEFESYTIPGLLSHFDTEAMGVDDEWGSWLVDAIEAKSSVYWEDGEPWIGESDDEDDQ